MDTSFRLTHLDLQEATTPQALGLSTSSPAFAVNVSCAALSSAIAVLQAIAAGTSNPWVKMSIAIAVQALQAYKSMKGCP